MTIDKTEGNKKQASEKYNAAYLKRKKCNLSSIMKPLGMKHEEMRITEV